MGCGTSQPGQPNHVKTVNTHPNGNLQQIKPNVNAWEQPNPMKSPYPQGKSDEVVQRMKDQDLFINDNVPVAGEVIDSQMIGKKVKESYAIQNGYTYFK